MKSICLSRPSAAVLNPGLAFLLLPLIALSLMLAWPDLADAKRLGGGGSFGSKPSYSGGYSKPVAPSKGNPAMNQATTRPQSRFGALGGMFGGLLMGGLIGSMLFGGGFGGPGLLDLLLLGGGAFLLFKFLRARKATTNPPYAYAGPSVEPARPAGGGGGWGQQFSSQPTPSGPVMPAGVDEREFLDGAKALYTRLQNSWDRRDLDDIRQFTSPEVLAEITRQASQDPTPGRTEILMLEARVLEARTVNGETVISVLFDAMLREDGPMAQAEQIREVWHIRRDENAVSPRWILEGIQQLAI